jgi:hypothetical protein
MSGDTWGTYKGEIKGFRFENSETKRLGPSIGGTRGGSQSEIDRDSDGSVGDGTPDERPAPTKKPADRYSEPGKKYPPGQKPTTLEGRNGNRARAPIAPKYKPGYLLEDENGELQQYDGPPPKNRRYLREKPDGSLQDFLFA